MFGETVVFGRLLEQADTPESRLSLLAEHVEGAIATVFRQTAMNRFEDAVHTARRNEGELSVERFGELWAETQTEMLGPAVEITEGYRTWWSYIPHFIGTPGYVYAYAYGQLLALSVYRQFEERDRLRAAVPCPAAGRRLRHTRQAGAHRRLRPGRPRLLGRRPGDHRQGARRGRAGGGRRRPGEGVKPTKPVSPWQVRRLASRAVYDETAIFAILDEALICHVGFVDDDQPYVLPIIHGRIDNTLYFHGSQANRMLGA